MFGEEDVRALHTWMSAEFRARGIAIAGFYYCPHHPDALCGGLSPLLLLPETGERHGRAGCKRVGYRYHEIARCRGQAFRQIALPGLRSVIVKSRYTGDNFDVADIAGLVNYL